MNRADLVKQYLDLGWVVMPTRADNAKAPEGDNWQDRTKPVRQARAYRHGIYLQTGKRSGVSVIDLDSAGWFDTFGELVVGKTPYARTPSGGAHILVSYSDADWWTNRVRLAENLDLRNDGGGIALPSGEDDRTWAPGHAPWEVDLATPKPFEELLLTLQKDSSGSSGGPTHTLTELLRNPPGPGARNDWLARVAGHMVLWVPFEDAFLELMHSVNRSLPDPLDEQEIQATVGKMWERDRQRNPIATGPGQDFPAEHDAGNLYYWRGQGNKRERHLWLEPAPEPVRQMRDDDGHLSWEVRNDDRRALVRPADIHNTGRISATLGNIGVLCYPRAVGSSDPHGAIFQKWLQSLDLPEIAATPYWGWSEELQIWVGLDDQAAGPIEHTPRIGWQDRPDIIEQLPTWQTAEVAAVFCAWVALQVVKGKIPTPIEPNLVLQGRAGAGKTRGLFAFGARLTGSERQAIGTVPTLRDRLSVHRNGIVVVDDQSDFDSLGKVLEIYRLSTSSESATLKQADRNGAWFDIQVPLVGSILVSGEALSNLSDDKALRDRSLILEVPPAAGRRSLIDPERTQWDDMQMAFRSLGGANEESAYELAGPFIKRILEAADRIPAPDTPADRITAKLELLRYGAELWQDAYPGSRTEGGHSLPEAVASWCSEQSSADDWRDLTLVRKILPELADPTIGANMGVRIHDGCLMVHVARTSRYWRERHRDPRNRELGSEANIRRELEALQAEGMVSPGHILSMGGQKVRCWRIGAEATDFIMATLGYVAADVATDVALPGTIPLGDG